MALETRESFYVDGHGEHPNVESARKAAAEQAAKQDTPVDVWQITRTKVLCFTRDVSVKETDLTAARDI